ncbi:unnamed protein product [Pedinophyceae sp. YPF-701]|nr:unnamed protein product [Pedinophyceae sp. YPF-701]
MAEARAAFRTLVRAAKQTFKGDPFMYGKAREEICSKFRESASVTDPTQQKEMIGMAYEAAVFLQESVVQVGTSERGNPVIGAPAGREAEGGTYNLVTPDEVAALGKRKRKDKKK